MLFSTKSLFLALAVLAVSTLKLASADAIRRTSVIGVEDLEALEPLEPLEDIEDLEDLDRFLMEDGNSTSLDDDEHEHSHDHASHDEVSGAVRLGGLMGSALAGAIVAATL